MDTKTALRQIGGTKRIASETMAVAAQSFNEFVGAFSEAWRCMTAVADACTTAILVVEDEWLIRATAADALGDYGYIVHEARHAAEAVSILEARYKDIHVIFTDVTLPGVMDGIGLAYHAAQHWPYISLIVVSAKPLHFQPPLPDGARFVNKPYVASQVIEHIWQLRAA